MRLVAKLSAAAIGTEAAARNQYTAGEDSCLLRYVAAWNGLLLETNLLLERMLANMWLLGTELLW